MCGLTFELRRDQRQDARPGLVKMYAYHQTGPGGLPLGLASSEGLGRSFAAAWNRLPRKVGFRRECTSNGVSNAAKLNLFRPEGLKLL